jgi:NAD+ synthase (glutamine-hydrolysing)
MSNLKVGAATLNQTPLDWERNKHNIIDALGEARRAGVKVLCLPEMAITGYGCEDHFLSEQVITTAWEIVCDLLPQTSGIFTCFGIPFLWCNCLYNVMVCVYDEKIIGIVPKQHLAGDGLHYEPRWFKPWPAKLVIEGPGYVIGDLVFYIDGVHIGFEICEDAFVAERPGNALARRGVNIILNPSASHFAFGKRVTRERLVVEGSRAFNVAYIYANLLGNEAGRAIYDGDCIVASGGDLLARGPFLNMAKVNLTTAVIDLSLIKTRAIATASFSPDLEAGGVVDYTQGLVNEIKNIACDEKATKPIQSESFTKHQEFTLAITLGLFDYLEKSHSKGFVVSLSGGADSAACASLVSLMIRRVINESQGIEDALNQFNIPIDEDLIKQYLIHGRRVLVEKLLTCVYQSTSNSSTTTLEAARAVANEIGAKFSVIDIDAIVKQYIALAEQVEGRALTWEHDDIALQNIQARARAPSIWMVANLEGKLLITTSNRSEAAVGYCTMDGDTAGSIAPIGGIDKAFLLEWLNTMVTDYPSLKGIVSQKPTAELRPGQGQTDEDDLMPYDILDAIETWAILEKKGPQEVLNCLRRERPDNPLAISYVRKFFTMWVRNQWKRERYAIAFHVDNHNLDPKTWCRFPVLSGGFVSELSQLK